jgi:hypothetical protein
MTRSTAFGLALAVTGALGMAAGCGGSSSDAASVLAPTGTLVTETFSGTVQPGGLDFKPFTITTGGTVNVTLVSAGPPPTITMGLGIGTPGAGTCALLSGATTTAAASTTAQLNGSLNAGSYCVEVLDVGNAAGPIAYTLTVAHT